METARDHVQRTTTYPAEFGRWLRDARAGDGSGFTAIYNWLAPEVKQFAVGRGARDADAATNDAFVACFGRLDEFRGDARGFRSWVFAIVRNRLIDQHRSESRRPPSVDGELPIEIPAPSAEELALAGLAAGRIAGLLQTLTDAQQEVLLLRVVTGLSLQETADVVGRPVTAVKRLQARALERLKQTIPDETVS